MYLLAALQSVLKPCLVQLTQHSVCGEISESSRVCDYVMSIAVSEAEYLRSVSLYTPIASPLDAKQLKSRLHTLDTRGN